MLSINKRKLFFFSDELVCEHYTCANEYCQHSYEVCSSDTPNYPACTSTYTVNPITRKLELQQKRCTVVSKADSSCDTQMCLIDTNLDITQKSYNCCCNQRLCNVNETFTYPIQLESYGKRACVSFNVFSSIGKKECQSSHCEYGCDIVNNQLVCTCPKGLVLVDKTRCEGTQD